MQMKKVLIIGGAGHGSVVASSIKDNLFFYKQYEWEVKGFINDFDKIVYESNTDPLMLIPQLLAVLEKSELLKKLWLLVAQKMAMYQLKAL